MIDNSCSIAGFEQWAIFNSGAPFMCWELGTGDGSLDFIVAVIIITVMMHGAYEVTVSVLFARAPSVPEWENLGVVLCAYRTM